MAIAVDLVLAPIERAVASHVLHPARSPTFRHVARQVWPLITVSIVGLARCSALFLTGRTARVTVAHPASLVVERQMGIMAWLMALLLLAARRAA